MRYVAAGFLASVLFLAALALGAIAIGFVLLLAPVILVAARWLGGSRRAPRRRSSPGAVYEGEFRVLDETVEERP
ncbi:MAG TPA: hypothetical protein VE935_02640 [Burkholderiales bacterium]|nr:hypothetical protein [Burkholderiales bacterium]